MAIKNLDGSKFADVFYHPNDILAKMIVDAWVDPDYASALKRNAKPLFDQAGLYLANPVVIDHTAYAKGYQKKSADEMTLVLPPRPEAAKHAQTSRASLMDTARIMMQHTPNGI